MTARTSNKKRNYMNITQLQYGKRLSVRKVTAGLSSSKHITRTNELDRQSLLCLGCLMPSSHHTTVFSCQRCEHNWRQVRTVGNRIFRNLTCLVVLQFCPVSKRVHTADMTGQNCSVSSILRTNESWWKMSPILFAPQTRQDKKSCLCVSVVLTPEFSISTIPTGSSSLSGTAAGDHRTLGPLSERDDLEVSPNLHIIS